MKHIDDFIWEFVPSLVIGFTSIAVYMMYSLGADHALMLIEQFPHASMNVVLFVFVWTLISRLLSVLIQALKKLKETHARNEVPQ